MSFFFPSPTTVEITAAVPTAAQISAQVWSDKESISAWRTYQVRSSFTPVQNTIYEIVSETGGVVIESLSVFHHNDETDTKDIDCLLTLDGTAYLYDASDIGGMLENAHNAFVLKTFNTAEVAYTLDQMAFQGGTNAVPPFVSRKGYSNAGDYGEGDPLFGHAIDLSIRMTSALGTNPTMAYLCTYRLLVLVA